MNHTDNMAVQQISPDVFEHLKQQHPEGDWLRIKINDLSLRCEETRYCEDSRIFFRTVYTDHRGANRTMQYSPGIHLPLQCDFEGRYDLHGVQVEVMWVSLSQWFLVRVESADTQPLYYRCTLDLVKAMFPRSMSMTVNRVSEVA